MQYFECPSQSSEVLKYSVIAEVWILLELDEICPHAKMDVSDFFRSPTSRHFGNVYKEMGEAEEETGKIWEGLLVEMFGLALAHRNASSASLHFWPFKKKTDVLSPPLPEPLFILNRAMNVIVDQ